MKKNLLFSMFAILALLLAACSGGSAATAPDASGGSTESKADDVLVAEAFHSLLYLPMYVGKSEGVFEKNNINITNIRSAGTGPTALASVLSGEAQFSIHGPEHVGFAKEKGGDAKAVSAVANSAPVWMLASEDVKYDSPADLKGKKIIVGLAPGTSNTLLKRLLKDNNLEIGKDVEVTEVQNGSELGPVLAGEADIAVPYQPQVEQGLAQGLKLIHNFTEDYPEYAFSTANTSQKMIEKNPDLVKRFVKSLNETFELMRSKPEVAKEVAKKEFPELEASVVEDAVQRMIDSGVYREDAEVTEDAFKTAIDMQKFVGNIEKDMNYEDIVDSQFFAQ